MQWPAPAAGPLLARFPSCYLAEFPVIVAMGGQFGMPTAVSCAHAKEVMGTKQELGSTIPVPKQAVECE